MLTVVADLFVVEKKPDILIKYVRNALSRDFEGMGEMMRPTFAFRRYIGGSCAALYQRR